MSWTYKQSNGEISSAEGLTWRGGYSGHGEGRNNPDMQDMPDIGPIPQGSYVIGMAYNDPGRLGPCVMHLDPMEGTNTFGRSLFRIHGDNLEHDASEGCIILSLSMRSIISTSGDRKLVVIS